MNMVDLEKTDAFLARNMTMTMQGGSPEQPQQMQEDWAMYSMMLIRQCVFEHADASGSDGKAYQVATMKVT